MTDAEEATRRLLLRCGFALEWTTLGWNVAGIVVLTAAALAARSVALVGFGLDSLIEIGARRTQSSPPGAVCASRAGGRRRGLMACAQVTNGPAAAWPVGHSVTAWTLQRLLNRGRLN